MKILKYILSTAAFLLATGVAFSSHLKNSAIVSTQSRFEQINTTPCILVTRLCSNQITSILCSVWPLYKLKTCNATQEFEYIFRP